MVIRSKLYLFALAVLTTDHGCTGLKQHRGVILQFWSSEGQHDGSWPNPSAGRGLRWRSHMLLLFPASGGRSFPWLLAPSSTFKASREVPLSPPASSLTSASITTSLFPCRDSCDHNRPPQMILENFPPPSTCQVPFAGLLGNIFTGSGDQDVNIGRQGLYSICHNVADSESFSKKTHLGTILELWECCQGNTEL